MGGLQLARYRGQTPGQTRAEPLAASTKNVTAMAARAVVFACTFLGALMTSPVSQHGTGVWGWARYAAPRNGAVR